MRGGKREGAGRKRIKPDEDSLYYSARLSISQKQRIEALGGAEWLRKQIDRTFPAIAPERGEDLVDRFQAMNREVAIATIFRLLDELDTLRMQGEPDVAEGWVCVPEEVWAQVMKRVFGIGDKS